MKMILARDLGGVIAVDGRIPWKLPTDMQRFAYLTKRNPGSGIGQPSHTQKPVSDKFWWSRLTHDPVVVMGSATYKSMPKGLLPARCNVVLSTDLSVSEAVKAESGRRNIQAYCFGDLNPEDSWLQHIESEGFPVWVIGGARVYEHMLGVVDQVHLTTVNVNLSALTMPYATALRDHVTFTVFDEKFEEPEWKCVERQFFAADEENNHEHVYEVFDRVYRISGA